jgi:hypothetical protein
VSPTLHMQYNLIGPGDPWRFAMLPSAKVLRRYCRFLTDTGGDAPCTWNRETFMGAENNDAYKYKSRMNTIRERRSTPASHRSASWFGPNDEVVYVSRVILSAFQPNSLSLQDRKKYKYTYLVFPGRGTDESILLQLAPLAESSAAKLRKAYGPSEPGDRKAMSVAINPKQHNRYEG